MFMNVLKLGWSQVVYRCCMFGFRLLDARVLVVGLLDGGVQVATWPRLLGWVQVVGLLDVWDQAVRCMVSDSWMDGFKLWWFVQVVVGLGVWF